MCWSRIRSRTTLFTLFYILVGVDEDILEHDVSYRVRVNALILWERNPVMKSNQSFHFYLYIDVLFVQV